MKNELQSQILNYRLQNIYDLTSSSHLFLLKFAVPDSKKLVIVDPGFRIHLTEFSRSTTQTPSGFVAKLRKHLKTRRLSRIALAPENRLLVFSFSDDHSYHLVLEFFAGGNMILLDKELKILSLQRTVSATETQTRCAVGEIYPLSRYLEVEKSEVSFTPDLVKEWLGGTNNNNDNENNKTADDDEDKAQRPSELLGSDNAIGGNKKKKKEPKIPLKKLLYIKVPGIAAGIFEQALAKHGIDPDIKEFASLTSDSTQLDNLIKALIDAQTVSEALTAQPVVPGYILAKKNPQFTGVSSDENGIIDLSPEISINNDSIEYLFEDFQPFEPRVPSSGTGFKIIKLDTFNHAVDKYFSTLESTKLSLKVSNQEQAAEKRLSAARNEKEKRVHGLVQVQEKSHVLGQALQSYANRVEEAADAVRGLMNQGMDWLDIENLIKVEQSRSNPVAQIIALPLNLIKNKITVILPDPAMEDNTDNSSDEDDDSDQSDDDSDKDKSKTTASKQSSVRVEIDLSLSAWANSRKYFDVKKTAAAKQERTVLQAEQAYKSAEKKIMRDLKSSMEMEKNQQHALHVIRETYWFEKFYWFLSSDGYLCIAGRDSFQNELLLRKYFKKGDIYVHCDITGAAVVIIKNHFNASEVPPSTLTQAGIFSVSSSTKAWDSKMVTSAWWATRSQIPRLTTEGDIVTSNMIVVNGEGKHFLPPCQLDMGLGFLWLVSEDSAGKYRRNLPWNNHNKPSVVETDDHKDDDSIETDEEDEFPDTQIDSEDEEFPDTRIESDVEEETDEEKNEVDNNDNEDDDNEEDEDEDAGEEKEVATPDVRSSIQQSEKEAKEDENLEQESGSTQSVKRLSIAERRKLRKQRSSTSNTPELESTSLSSAPPPTSSSSSAVADIEKALGELQVSRQSQKTPAEQKPPKIRGKKGKMKKIATKYADQDEEERKQRMELLGTTRGLEKAKAAAQEAKDKRQQQEQARRDRQERAKQQEKKRLLEIDEAGDEGDEDDDSKYPFDLLVPRLASGDTPLTVIPVFGPWGSMQRYKYKIKMQPGTVKKGKAVKDVLHGILNAKVDPTGTDPDFAWPSELALVRTVKEAEVVLAIGVGRVKVSVPGAGQNTGKGGKGNSGKNKSSKR